MIFGIYFARITANFSFIRKPYTSNFTVLKNAVNVRLLCNVQTEHVLQKEAEFFDKVSNLDKIRLTESLYFRNLMENNPKYPDLNFSEKLLKENELSTNKLVIFLRNAVNSKTSQENESGSCQLISILTDFKDDVYTLHDFIEIFHFLPVYLKLFPRLEQYEVNKLNDLMMKKAHDLQDTKKNLQIVITLLNLMKNVVPIKVAFPLVMDVFFKIQRLTTVQLVEYFYILHYFRLRYKNEMKYAFEMFLISKLPELNLDEIAVLSFGFFRSQVIPGSLLIEAVSKRIVEDFEKLNDIQACTIFKFFQFAGRRRISENLRAIFEKCIPIIHKFNVMTAIHIVCSGVSVNVENKELFELVWKRANDEFDSLRLKDMERLLLASLYTNFHLTEDSDFVKLVLKKIKKENNEIAEYPRSFYALLIFLIMHNIYVEDLIVHALTDEFLQIAAKKHAKTNFHELLFIDASVTLERPEYKINHLPLKKRKTIAMKTTHDYLQNESSSRKCSEKIMNALHEIYGKESSNLIRPLVHYDTLHPVLCINKNNEPQAIGDKLKQNTFDSIKVPKDGNLWICFVLLRWQSCLYDRVTPNLVTEAKLRHFRVAGYIPITVHNFLFLKKTDEEVREFVSEAVKDKVRSLSTESQRK